MQSGFLITETIDTHPGLVRLYTSDTLPPLASEPNAASLPIPRHAVFFDDLSAARMHAHELLRRGVVDVGAGLYRSSPMQAAAAVESIGLRKKRAYLDPNLANDPELTRAIATFRSKGRRSDRTWQILGYLAIGILIAKLLFGL
jgi:hypothetical protein